MADKIIAMPTDDELFAAFQYGLEAGTPEQNKNILGMFEKFIGKAKEHLKTLVTLQDNGLALNFNEQSGNQVLEGFIEAQGFLLKLPLKGVLATFGASTFTDFVNSVKSGKNGRESTVGGITKILIAFFEKIGEKYETTDDAASITAKVEAVFAEQPAAPAESA